MIDIHCHILPGVDDGSASVDESLKLLEMLQQQGVRRLVATPHFYPTENTPELFLQQRDSAFQQLRNAGADTGIILPGAEVAYYEGMSKSQVLPRLQLGNSGLLLVEMPFRDWNIRMIEDVCNLSLQLGLQPILAHVERYPGKHQLVKYMDILLNNGVLFQCNAAAFLKGWKSRKYFSMLKNGQIHFLGSDCHNLTSRAPELDKAAAAIHKKFGPDLLAELNANAEKLLFGQKS